jgi:hypothetical protein
VENARDRVRRQLRPVPLPRQRHVVEHRDGERRGFPGSPPSARRSGRHPRKRWRRLHRDRDVNRAVSGQDSNDLVLAGRAVPRSESVSQTWHVDLSCRHLGPSYVAEKNF